MVAGQIRVAARRSVVDAQAERRRLRQEREDRIAALAIEVNVALASGRTAMARAEQVAGQALGQMFDLGLTTSQVIDWCAVDITSREIARLRRLGDQDADHPGSEKE